MVVELNRRLVQGYTKYKDDQRIVQLKGAVLGYNRRLKQLNIRDHQVEYAKLSRPLLVLTLLYRLGKLGVLTAGVLPGLILFAPVFITGKVISVHKAKQALAASTVKIHAKDVVATWKLLVALVVAPTLYTLYDVLLCLWTYHNRVQGLVPDSVPLWAIFVFGFLLFPSITFAALRFGEVGMDIAKSLRPLLVALSPSSGNSLVQLRRQRAALAHQVMDLINTLGPEMFPDFDSARIIADPQHSGLTSSSSPPSSPSASTKLHRIDSDSLSLESVPSSPSASATDVSMADGPSAQGRLPRNDSFKDISSVGIFATRPTTPSRSRSRTGSGHGLHGLSTLDSKEGLEEVSKKIRGAMRERGQQRRSRGSLEHEASRSDSEA